MAQREQRPFNLYARMNSKLLISIFVLLLLAAILVHFTDGASPCGFPQFMQRLVEQEVGLNSTSDILKGGGVTS
jgi:hypothetical protein